MERQVCSASDIFRDILALYDEFEEVAIDLNEHTLAVTTDRIVLDDVNLGPFKIRLDWHGLCSSVRIASWPSIPIRPPRAKTLPIPTSRTSCFARVKAARAIHAALAECRLHDFFMLVDQVLHTYGRGSAYVELDRWGSIPCEECGDSVDEDDSILLPSLRGDALRQLLGILRGLWRFVLLRLPRPCAACGHDHCSSCLATCPVCHKRFCDDCRQRVAGVGPVTTNNVTRKKTKMIRRRKKLATTCWPISHVPPPQNCRGSGVTNHGNRRPCDSAPPPGRSSCICATLATPRSAVLESALPMIYCTSRTYSLCGKYARACRSASTTSRWRSSSTGRLIWAATRNNSGAWLHTPSRQLPAAEPNRRGNIRQGLRPH